MSNFSAFNTEIPTMETASRHVFEINDQIQGTLASLLSRLEPLFSTWQGEAATSFHRLKERWHEEAGKLNEALRGIGDGLVSATTNYRVSEEANTSGFSGIEGVL